MRGPFWVTNVPEEKKSKLKKISRELKSSPQNEICTYALKAYLKLFILHALNSCSFNFKVFGEREGIPKSVFLSTGPH